MGHIATQSSVSRDLRELGVAKLGDRYVLPETAAPPKSDFSALKQFVSARLTAGTQSHRAENDGRIGAKRGRRHRYRPMAEVVGTISGDDTIFIATAGARAQRKLGDRLLALFGR